MYTLHASFYLLGTKTAERERGIHPIYHLLIPYTPSHLHAACDKEKPSGTCTITTEWTAVLPVLGCCCAFDVGAAGADESVLLLAVGTPELLSFRRRLLAGATTVDMVDPLDSADAARRLEARVDMFLAPLAVVRAKKKVTSARFGRKYVQNIITVVV